MIPAKAAGHSRGLQRFGNVGLLRRAPQQVPPATVLAQQRQVRGELAASVQRIAIEACTARLELTPGHLRESVAVDVHGAHGIGLGKRRQRRLPIAGRPVERGVPAERRQPLHRLDAQFGARAGARRLTRDDVDDAADSAGPVERRPAALHHLDPLDLTGGYLLEAVHGGQRRERRLAIEQNLRVRAVEAEEPNLREVARLTVVLDADAGGELHGVSQRPGRGRLDVGTTHQFRADGHPIEPLARARRRHDGLVPEAAGREDDVGDGRRALGGHDLEMRR